MSHKQKGYISAGKSHVTVMLAVNIFKQGSRYIADCPALQLSTHGKSTTEVKRHFEETLTLWLETTLEHRTLHSALKELGWKFVHTKAGTLEPQPRDFDSHNAPISLLAQHYIPFSVPTRA